MPTLSTRGFAALCVWFLAVHTAAATETEFWKPYRGADENTYLLAGFDDDALPSGSARVTAAAKTGRVEKAEGRFGRGLYFDGRSSMRYTAAEVFPGPYVAIEAWLKLDTYPTKRAYLVHRPAQVDANPAYDPETDVTKGFGLFVDHEGALHLEITNCGYGQTILTSSKPGVVPTGKWVHVAGISVNFPIAYRRLTVDGREVAAEAITWGKGLMVHGDEEKKPGPVYLGNNAAGDAGLVGALDQVRIHRKIGRFWPNEEEPWTKANRPGQVPDGPPYFQPGHGPSLYLPLDGKGDESNLPRSGPPGASHKLDSSPFPADAEFAPGVCGQALVGKLDLSAPDLLDLREGTIEFWLRPGGVNSVSDCNYGFVQGPFIFYIYNSGTFENKPLSLYFRKPDGELHFVKAGDFETHPGRWYHFVIAWQGDEIAIYADGRPGEHTYGVPLATDPNQTACRQLGLSAPGSLVDEVRLYRKALSPQEAANAYWRYVDRAKLVPVRPESVALRAQYFPSQGRIYYELRPEVADTKEAVLVLRSGGEDGAGKPIMTKTVPIAAGEQTLDVPDLPDGRYVLSAAAVGADGKGDESNLPQSGPPGASHKLDSSPFLRASEFAFRRQHFAWENNRLGATDEVYPPFTPARTEGSTVRVVGREYKLNGFGLPESITSAGRELLAGPAVLRVETGEGEGRWTVGKSGFTASRPNLAVFEAQSASPGIRVKTRTSIEVDGCAKVELSLLPGDEAREIERLWLEIPMRAAEAPLMHAVTAGVRQNYSGAVPLGQGVVWDGSKAHQYQRWLNAFVPYVWLGSANRGLAWFAENDRGWITRKTPEGRIQELVREGDRLVLRVYLVNQPASIGERRDLVFGLQASPTKPMPEDWRVRVRHAPGGLAVVPWGGLQCASQAPFRDDWQIVDKICECREGKPFDAAWFRAYAEKHQPPPAHGNWPWLDQVAHFAGRAREVGHGKPLAVYQEEMRGCAARPEWAVFQDEWTTEPFRFQRTELPERVFRHGYDSLGGAETITFPSSYQDFGCSIADQWLARGVSLYWDNTYPYVSTNTRTTAAYRAEDGRVQPCMVIWNHREYTKRTWHVLQGWRRKRPEPLKFTLHMTNTLLLPVHTWGTVNLDHELDTRKPFSPEWLQTETVGRQVGNMPLSLYNVTGQAQKALEGLSPQDKALAEWGMRAVHEIGRDGPMEKALADFGYGTPAVTVHNYWADRPAMRVRPEAVKWLLLARPEKKDYLVVLASWSEQPEKVEAAIDPAVLGFGPDGGVRDVTADRPAGEVRGGKLAFEMGQKYQVRVFHVGAAAAP